ncbi:MAG: hypothetical protein LBT48_08040 [Prevotellaceae bacterium]|jgi:uncharacterized protein YhjY with autotransporter beta-barrel domain|nr:hypothetical protein [Prevotellaceae bacterium]
MKKCICFCLFAVMASSVCRLQAQTRTGCFQPVPENSRKYSIAVEPYAFVTYGNIRLQFEKRVGNLPHWIQLSPAFYFMPYDEDRSFASFTTVNSADKEVHGLLSGGLELGYKMFFNNTVETAYCKAGISYNYFDVTYLFSEYKLLPYQEDGLTYYTYNYIDQTENQYFHKTNVTVCFGYQSDMRHPLFLDAYIGLSYSHSFYDDQKQAFDESIFGLGYRGLALVFGLRAGLTFGKTKAGNQ